MTTDSTDANLKNRPVIMAGLMICMFLAAIEGTVVATAMPSVVQDLGGLLYYGLVGSSYLLASTVTIPVYGRLADLRGRKIVLLFGIGLFLLGSMVCAFAHSLGLLITGRVLQGLGAGAIQPITITLVGDLYELKERGPAQALMGSVWAFAGITGPISGGFLVSTLGWRSIFWLNIPVGILAAGMVMWKLREPGRSATAAPIDWLGAGLLVAGSSLLLAATGSDYGFALAAAGAAILGWLVVHCRRNAAPILPFDLLLRRDVLIASLSGTIIGICFMSVLNYLPLYLQLCLGKSPAVAGSTLTPLLIGWPISATLTSSLLPRIGFRRPLIAGSLTIVVVMSALRWWMSHPDAMPLWPIMLLMGMGFGLCTVSMIIAVQTSVSYHQRGLATAFNMFSRSMGGALGVGLAGLIVGVSLGAQGHGAGAPSHDVDPALLMTSLGRVFAGLVACAALHVPLCWMYPAVATTTAAVEPVPPLAAME